MGIMPDYCCGPGRWAQSTFIKFLVSIFNLIFCSVCWVQNRWISMKNPFCLIWHTVWLFVMLTLCTAAVRCLLVSWIRCWLKKGNVVFKMFIKDEHYNLCFASSTVRLSEWLYLIRMVHYLCIYPKFLNRSTVCLNDGVLIFVLLACNQYSSRKFWSFTVAN